MKPTIETTKYKSLLITVENVFKANFNDSYWLCEKSISLDELNRDELVWFDPYLGKSDVKVEIALSYCSDERFVILEKRDDKTVEHVIRSYSQHIVCDDAGVHMLIAAHVELR